jgi:hypothetical protein
MRMVPVKDKDKLEVFWVLPYVSKEYKTKPL